MFSTLSFRCYTFLPYSCFDFHMHNPFFVSSLLLQNLIYNSYLPEKFVKNVILAKIVVLLYLWVEWLTYGKLKDLGSMVALTPFCK